VTLFSLLGRIIKVGSLTVIDPAGRVHRLGNPNADPGLEPVTIRLHDRAALWKLALRPSFAFGQAYMDGALAVERGTLRDLLELCGRNLARRRPGQRSLLLRLARPLARRWQQFNPAGRARRNAAHHYDLSETLFRLFLDEDLQYSCAYFAKPGWALEEAQRAKLRHIAAKLLLKPGLSVLDIGSGWGGLAFFLAGIARVKVTGITLSSEQLATARQRAEHSGPAGHVVFALQDYRATTGRYDRIVSVGMFEHVGTPHYPAFFDKIHDLLANDGVALIHSIGRMDGPGLTSAWTRKYIFPGGYIPALSEVLPAVERAGLWVTDIEILRLHYAETLRCWFERFRTNRDQVQALYNERFCRMWELYLAGSEMAFRHGGLMVFQLQLAKRVDTVPLTRDYMIDAERGLRLEPAFPHGMAAAPTGARHR
jgi:cyclopropane-fatty-acyl-phospholipid synthase